MTNILYFANMIRNILYNVVTRITDATWKLHCTVLYLLLLFINLLFS